MILIDDRDGSRDLASEPVLDGRCSLDRLEFEIDGKSVACGDVMLTGHGPDNSVLRVGVEVKSLSDVLTSISTGRLGGAQIPRMLKVFNVIFILTYGIYRIGTNNFLQVRRGQQWTNYRIGRRPVPWSYLEGFFLSAQIQATLLSKPLFWKHCYDLTEAACWLRVLDSWLDKPWDKHRALAVFDKSRELAPPPDADPVEVQIAKTAASLPAIDWVRGHAAAKHFDSVDEMINADVDDWMGIKGIGPVLAKSAVRAIRQRKGNR